MPLYAGKYAICAFLQNMRNMLRSHDRYKPVSLVIACIVCLLTSIAELSTFCYRRRQIVFEMWTLGP